MEALREQSCCRVRLSAKGAREERFRLPGVSDLTVRGSEVSFLYRGSPNDLTEGLRGVPMGSLWIDEPSLEEIFLHYYEGGE